MPLRASDQRVHQVRLLAGALALSVGAMLPVALTGALAVQLRADLAVSDAWMGAAVSAFFLAGGSLAVTVSRRVDVVGWRRGLLAAATLAALALVTIALLVHAWWLLTLSLAVAGEAIATDAPSGNLALATEMPPHRLGLVMGLRQTAIPAAMLLSGVAVPGLALTVGWRWAFALAACWPIAGLLLLPRPRATTTRAVERTGGRGRIDRAWEISLASGIASVLPGALTGFFVLTAVDAGLAGGVAGVLLAVTSAGGLVVRTLAGWIADRSATDGFRPVAALLFVGAVGVGFLAAMRPATVVVGGLLAVLGGWGWPGLYFYAVVRANLHAAGAATGAAQSGGMLGTAVGPLVFGLLLDAVGATVAWTVVAVTTAVAGLLVLRVATPRASIAEVG